MTEIRKVTIHVIAITAPVESDSQLHDTSESSDPIYTQGLYSMWTYGHGTKYTYVAVISVSISNHVYGKACIIPDNASWMTKFGDRSGHMKN